MNFRVIQTPYPGTRLLKFRGDTLKVEIRVEAPAEGDAFLRTNIGQGEVSRQEIIRMVERQEHPLAKDWYDIPMKQTEIGRYQVLLPMCEVGHFEAKGYFRPKTTNRPIWPEGHNLSVNVEPAHTCCGNIIYNAFIRQFGPNKHGGFFNSLPQNEIHKMDKLGFVVIPPSGTFRDLIREIDFIIQDLGCRYIQLLPIHPTPTTYARMGRYGSPYAALSFTAVDPALAKFDVKATPLEQFIELVDEIHYRNGKILIDIAINHTGWAASLHEMHPEWLSRDAEGRIEMPGAWGVRWEDLTKLDYNRKDLWKYMSDVFLTWCRRGVDGFRCDAGYMIPIEAWRYMISCVRNEYPDTLFFLEGLGGKVSVARDLLNIGNFNWAYSELFQNYDRQQIERYLQEAIDISGSDGLMVHYAETHDNNRLASRSSVYAKMRTALCALVSHSGAFGFANGVEWFATEKIIVHESPSLNWNAATNQVHEIGMLSRLLKNHPVFWDNARLNLVQTGNENCIVLLRHHEPTGKRVIVTVNLDDHRPNTAQWNMHQTKMAGHLWTDLLTETKVKVDVVNGVGSLYLSPGQAMCLTDDPSDRIYVQVKRDSHDEPKRIEYQRLQAKVMDVIRYYRGVTDISDLSLPEICDRLRKDPVEFCRSMGSCGKESRVIRWEWPRDITREVMVPPGHFLLVRAKNSFRAQIIRNTKVVRWEESLPDVHGIHFALFMPITPPNRHTRLQLKLILYDSKNGRHVEAPLLFLSSIFKGIKKVFKKKDFELIPLYYLAVNGSGGMIRQPVDWGNLTSRYDAVLSANFNRKGPSDRWILVARYRAWVVYEDYSQEVNTSCLESFFMDDHRSGTWRFKIPTGRGKQIRLNITLSMRAKENIAVMSVLRESEKGENKILEDDYPVRIILRPDIEDRSAHDVTKAYLGPEHQWRSSIDSKPDGFIFKPGGTRELRISINRGEYVHEPEWQYMVFRSQEAQRGQDPNSDLFSPGYFSTSLHGGQEILLTAEAVRRESGIADEATSDGFISGPKDDSGRKKDEFLQYLTGSMIQYITEREGIKTVLAGYPWFLDWGRDSLIFARGLIAIGQTDTACSILKQFGRFEVKGTLPNMIGESGPANRDTSDAPLWFCLVCEEVLQTKGYERFIDEICGNRSIREILLSIVDSMIHGTMNGIIMDSSSGLIFSPAHFTWMDTNFPAGTPRQGFPIEIQSLWYRALKLVAQIAPSGMKAYYRKLARQVKKAIVDLFFLKEIGYMADCLVARPGDRATDAEKDDALRPNQLLGLTMGAIEDDEIGRKIIFACEELLIPGGIRSLADRPLKRPLDIIHHGRKLTDPEKPYKGKYQGDEDTQRKPAYHNGTAWTWLFPVFCEAYALVFGDEGIRTAGAYLGSLTQVLNRGCVGHIPEILDGDFPHLFRGCDAQAWGISETARVWKRLFTVSGSDGHFSMRFPSKDAMMV